MPKKQSFLFLFLSALPAGLCIGLGGAIFLRLRDLFPGANVVGAFLFSVGLFTICTKGYALYTGRVCSLFRQPRVGYLLDLFFIWLGNFFGVGLTALLLSLTGPARAESGLIAQAKLLVTAKMGDSLLSLLLLGLFCGIFIYIAVGGFAQIADPVGKYIALFLGVMGFILAGTEHSIADMFYWCLSGELLAAPGESLLRLCIISVGNGIGGVLLPLLEDLLKKLQPETP